MTTVGPAREGASPRRGTLAVVALVGASAVGWAVTVRVSMGSGMDDEIMITAGQAAAFVTAWVSMMAAMMLPSAAPFVRLYAAGARETHATSLLVAGYLAVWAAFGILAYAAHVGVDALGMGKPRGYVVAATLVGAGVYQLTPLKAACLRRCRSPVGFLMERWRAGRLGALRLGADHGAYCLGCCCALMVVLVVAGAMSLVWVAAIAVAVFAEKLLPGGDRIALAFGLALVALGIVVAVRPELAMRLAM